jgi:O-antigen ligase
MNSTKTKYHFDKIRLWLLMAVAFTIPLPYAITLNSILIIILSVLWLTELTIYKLYHRLKNKWIWLFLSVFVLYLISGLWAENIKIFSFELEKKITLFLFPLIIGTSNITTNNKQKILLSFIFSCFLLFSISIFSNLYLNYNDSNTPMFFPDYYSGEQLVFRLKLHRVYVSIHALFSVLALVSYNNNTINKYIKYFLIVSLLLYAILLSSRIIIIAIFVLGVIYIIYAIIKNNNFMIKQFILFVLFSILLSITIIKTPKIRNNLADLTSFEQYEDVKNVSEGNGVHCRYLIWKATKQAIKESPIIGYGAGDSQMALNKQYELMGFELALKNPYNAHNQYLQIWLDTGIIGFLFLLSFFIISAYQAFKAGNELYFMFLALMSLCFLTENLLSNQKGIVFFAFFNSLLYFSSTNKIHSIQ